MFSHSSQLTFFDFDLLAGHRLDPSSKPTSVKVLFLALLLSKLPFVRFHCRCLKKDPQDKAAENKFSEFFLPRTAPSEKAGCGAL